MVKNSVCSLFVAVIFVAGVTEAQNVRDMKVSAFGLNVRTSDGEILCSLKKNDPVKVVGRLNDGQRVKVRINKRHCPSEGYVYKNFLKKSNAASASEKPSSAEDSDFEVSKVDIDHLSLRSSTRVSQRTYLCSLSRNTQVKILDDAPTGKYRTQWYKVRLMKPKKGCPQEGYLNGSYLTPVDDFSDLPEERETILSYFKNSSEASAGCDDCLQVKDKIAEFANELDSQNTDNSNDFLNGLRALIKNPREKVPGLETHRGLVQMPLIGQRGNIGACGSHHYSPDKPVGIDAYANPVTACAFTSFLQDWKKKQCPDSTAGCTVQWGDISHRTRPKFGGHQSHTDGECIDIRPLRKGDFSDSSMSYKRKGYDRTMTKAMISMMKEKGASVVLYNDRKAGGEYNSGHDNHIHVCFPKSPKTLEVCRQLIVDPKTCPELQ